MRRSVPGCLVTLALSLSLAGPATAAGPAGPWRAEPARYGVSTAIQGLTEQQVDSGSGPVG